MPPSVQLGAVFFPSDTICADQFFPIPRPNLFFCWVLSRFCGRVVKFATHLRPTYAPLCKGSKKEIDSFIKTGTSECLVLFGSTFSHTCPTHLWKASITVSQRSTPSLLPIECRTTDVCPAAYSHGGSSQLHNVGLGKGRPVMVQVDHSRLAHFLLKMNFSGLQTEN